jgi:hypothetical protein
VIGMVAMMGLQKKEKPDGRRPAMLPKRLLRSADVRPAG